MPRLIQSRYHERGVPTQRRCAARKDFDRVAEWSVDRLGRNLQDLPAFLLELQSKRADLYLLLPDLDDIDMMIDALSSEKGADHGAVPDRDL
jgi:hypothetical protein